MESLYLLVPLSAVLVLFILAVFGWAVQQGQFDDIEAEGQRILTADTPRLDADQGTAEPRQEE
jgi:cbb3-type cytochrome oxidase maturation protein